MRSRTAYATDVRYVGSHCLDRALRLGRCHFDYFVTDSHGLRVQHKLIGGTTARAAKMRADQKGIK